MEQYSEVIGNRRLLSSSSFLDNIPIDSDVRTLIVIHRWADEQRGCWGSDELEQVFIHGSRWKEQRLFTWVFFFMYLFRSFSFNAEWHKKIEDKQYNAIRSCDKHSFLLNLDRYKQIEIVRERERMCVCVCMPSSKSDCWVFICATNNLQQA